MNASRPIESLPTGIEWREDPDPADWDSALARLGGHPLQSALWGDTRKAVDGIRDSRWMALKDGAPVYLIRCEERPVPVLGKIAWAPKGPTGAYPGIAGDVPPFLIHALKQRGFILLVTDHWKELPGPGGGRPLPRTIKIDLNVGRERLWHDLDKQWRYGVGRAKKLGVMVDTTGSAADIESFSELCTQISQTKGFRLVASPNLMKRLLDAGTGRAVDAHLFAARYNGCLVAGALIIRCGSSIHYFWGGTDRAYSNERAGEVIQWAVIEWALERNCTCYDLEGIDPIANPGVYAFKKKMGGKEVTLAGKQYYALGARGRLAACLDAHFRR